MVERAKTSSQRAASSASSVKGCYFRQVVTSGLPHLRNDGTGLEDFKNSCQIKVILRYLFIFKANNRYYISQRDTVKGDHYTQLTA